jgi:hypothetical protein
MIDLDNLFPFEGLGLDARELVEGAIILDEEV